VRLTGKVGNMDQEIVIPVNPADASYTHKGIACVWARKKIESLAGRAVFDSHSAIKDKIKQVALEYGLMSSYTAFVAVDSSRQTADEYGTTVAAPVPVPYGVRYDTTIQE
jgi:Ca-activated chloride channel family protein